jgi:hypothetical protein
MSKIVLALALGLVIGGAVGAGVRGHNDDKQSLSDFKNGVLFGCNAAVGGGAREPAQCAALAESAAR